ncbi:MAG: LuxR C-terminal-related transcriptional regulator [Cyanobacteriota/Melainabacteria group bacterium]
MVKSSLLLSLRAGAAGYITKEHKPTDELVRGIESTLSGRRFITESVASNLADYFSLEQSVSPHDSLSARELEVLRFIAAGHSVSEIAGMLSLR